MYESRIIESLNLECEEADGLESCVVATPDGMVDLVLGIVGTASGSAGASRINERGTLESYFDGNGDQFSFGSANTINITADFTIVWEVYFDGMGGANDAYPGIGIFARGAADPFRLGYSTDAAYDDIYFGTRGGTQHAYLLPSGLTKTLQRHLGVLSYTAGVGYSVWVNGQACTSTTCGSLATITDDTRVGGTSGTTSDVFGGIRQVRRYSRAWTEAEAVRLWTNKDRLYRPRRRRALTGIPAAGGATSWTITPSGGVVLSGAPAIVHGKVFPASGGVTVAGTAAMLRGRVYAPDGGVAIGGAAPLLFAGTHYIAPSGGITIGGTAPLAFTSAAAGQGNRIKHLTGRAFGHKGFETWRMALN